MRNFRLVAMILTVVLAGWWLSQYRSDWNFARGDYELVEVDGPTFTVLIPKGWRKPDYANPRESKKGFTTSSSESGGSLRVEGALSIEDEGAGAKIEAVLADWRKDEGNGSLNVTKIAGNEAWTWRSTLSFVDISGEARTFVFRGSNGHVYSAHYQLAQKGRERMRQEYVFGRILASMKFKS